MNQPSQAILVVSSVQNSVILQKLGRLLNSFNWQVEFASLDDTPNAENYSAIIVIATENSVFPPWLLTQPIPLLLLFHMGAMNLAYYYYARLPVMLPTVCLLLEDTDAFWMALPRALQSLIIRFEPENASDAHQAEIALLRREAATALRAKDEFLANMSHSLRTPLNGIMGNAQILGHEIYGELNPQQHKCVNVIERSGENLLAMINDVLDMAQVDVGIIRLNMLPVNPISVCHNALTMIQPMARHKSLNVELTLDQQVTEVVCDEKRVRQILLNLLSNAVKFTEPGGSVGVVLAGDRQNSQVLFTVWDTGIGFAKEFAPHIFEPFRQEDSSLVKRQEGTGIGLALAYRLVILHGGQMTAESKPGDGSRFTFSIPWRLPEKSDSPEDSSVEYQPKFNSTLVSDAPETVLIAEDNELNRETFRDFVEYAGFKALLAVDGQELLDLAEQRLPNLILMDVQMPKVNGLDAIRILKSNPKTKHIPIIVLSGYTMMINRDRIFEAGADDYLSKPVILKELLAKISRFVTLQVKD